MKAGIKPRPAVAARRRSGKPGLPPTIAEAQHETCRSQAAGNALAPELVESINPRGASRPMARIASAALGRIAFVVVFWTKPNVRARIDLSHRGSTSISRCIQAKRETTPDRYRLEAGRDRFQVNGYAEAEPNPGSLHRYHHCHDHVLKGLRPAPAASARSWKSCRRRRRWAAKSSGTTCARLDRCTGCLARKGKCQPQTSNARQRDNHRDPAIHGRIDQTV